MRKWIDEKVLQYYFQQNCDKYEIIINGERQKIKDCNFNDIFDNFPDLKCTVGGQTVDCEVEWLSSRFDHWNHKYFLKFKKRNGFVAVFKKDQELSDLQQIVIDELDFEKWFRKNAKKIFNESIKEFREIAKHKRKTAAIWIIYITNNMSKNFQVGIEKGTWGFVRDSLKNRKEILEIKKDDILVFFGPTVNMKTNKSIFARMKGSFDVFYKHIKNEEYVIQNISLYSIDKSYWNEESNPAGPNGNYEPIWSDESLQNKKYPHRIGFKKLISTSNDVKLKKLSKSTVDTLRKCMQGISITRMSNPDFVELIRRMHK